ncbi:MAG: hypothetical protein FD126_369 [Elusimicrobia bacterium]|nr:MAG: hypothetical protein FD126_369 [Elusimicrobiota bacterium]
MAILKDILRESLDYYLDLDKRLNSRLEKLPRGSILKRRIGRKDYYYLKLREGKRVVSRYLGRERPAELEKSLAERRLIRSQIKEVEKNLEVLARAGRRRGK